MRQGNKKIFLNKAKLTEMLNLRRNGFPYSVLSSIFGVDRKSLSYQADRYQIIPKQVYYLKGIVNKYLPKPEVPKWKIINSERFII